MRSDSLSYNFFLDLYGKHHEVKERSEVQIHKDLGKDKRIRLDLHSATNYAKADVIDVGHARNGGAVLSPLLS